jgi:hypothetical protein
MPVHFELCAQCEAINHRNAERCHKCGSRLSLSPEFEPEPEGVLADTMASSSLDGWPVADAQTPVSEMRPHSRDAAVDGGGPNLSGGTERRVRTDETVAAAPRQPTQQDFAVTPARAEPVPAQATVAQRRPLAVRTRVMVVMLAAVAVTAYLAYQNPERFRAGVHAITARFDALSDVQLTSSPKPISVDSLASQQQKTTAALPSPQDAAQNSIGPASESNSSRLDAIGQSQSPPDASAAAPSPPLDATRDSQSQSAVTASEPRSPPVKGTLSSAETRATSRSQGAKNVRQPPVRSSASSSKQANASKKVASPKAADARARAKASDARRSKSKEQAGEAAALDIPMVAD